LWGWARTLNVGERIALLALVFGIAFVVATVAANIWATIVGSLQPEIVDFNGTEYDLIAQRSMAAAAWWMVLITGTSTIVGSLGLYLIYRTLKEAKRSADAADKAVDASHKAIETARQMGQAQVRAYVVITSVKMFPDGYGSTVVDVQFQNSGQTPASKIWVNTNIFSAVGAADALLADEHGDAHSDLAAGAIGNIQFVGRNLFRRLVILGTRVTSKIYLDVEIMYDDVFDMGQETLAAYYGFATAESGSVELTRDLA